MNIPKAREELGYIVRELFPQNSLMAERIDRIIDNHMMKAQPIHPIAPEKSRKITPALAHEIRQAKANNPHLSNQELAEFFNLNPGRVSEALQGKR